MQRDGQQLSQDASSYYKSHRYQVSSNVLTPEDAIRMLKDSENKDLLEASSKLKDVVSLKKKSQDPS